MFACRGSVSVRLRRSPDLRSRASMRARSCLCASIQPLLVVLQTMPYAALSIMSHFLQNESPLHQNVAALQFRLRACLHLRLHVCMRPRMSERWVYKRRLRRFMVKRTTRPCGFNSENSAASNPTQQGKQFARPENKRRR